MKSVASLSLLSLLVLVGPACGGDEGDGPRDALADAVDTDDAVGPSDGDAAEDGGDENDAVGPDALDEVDDADVAEVEVVEPRLCQDFEACNAPLDGAGLCPGRCMPVDDVLRCEGEVKLGVCHRLSTGEATVTTDFGTHEVQVISAPVEAVVGETYPFEVRLVNKTNAELDVPFRWKNPQTWLVEGATWADAEGFQLEANATATLTATLTAQQPTVFSAGGDIVVTLVFGTRMEGTDEVDNVFEPRAAVLFPDTEAVSCGQYHFPATWCGGECETPSHSYFSAVCCDGVFFPGAMCCSDAECTGGACVDGKCVSEVPWLGSANGLPIGNQRIRFVLVDSHTQFEDPCENRFEDVKDEIDFATIESWYADLAMRRAGREVVDFQWIVTGGVQASDFLTGPNYWSDYSRELDAWLAARGCPMLEGYDKLIVSAPTMDFWGFGGLYFEKGHMAIWSPYNAYLIAHEMAHSYGARDLYLDLAGTLQYPLELMGNMLSGPPHPGDEVAWAEMGFGDLDRNGVLDFVEMAAFPDVLSVASLTATLTTKNSIELRWEFVGIEDGVAKRMVIPSYGFAFPAAGVDFTTTYSGRFKTMAFDGTQVDLEAIRAAGEVTVQIRAQHTFTGRDWQPRVLELDETMVVPVTIAE